MSCTPPWTTSAPVSAKQSLDVTEEVAMDLVLGVEHPRDLAPALRQRRVQGLGLVLGPVRVDHHADAPGVLGGHLASHRLGARVVVADDGEHLDGGMVDGGQAPQGRAQHGLFVAGRHDERERALGVAKHGARSVPAV
jgi:hypothetical protein